MAKSFKIVWSSTAIKDLDGILDYISCGDSPDVVAKIHKKLINKIDNLEKYPGRGRIVPELREISLVQYRELIDTPYRIFYRIHEGTVELLGILDGRIDLEEILLERVL